jgi:hypothetical protein
MVRALREERFMRNKFLLALSYMGVWWAGRERFGL